MLIPGFYTIESFNTVEKQITAYLKLNPKHDVYKGHFPEQAVVPGVIQLQIIKELVEKHEDSKLMLSKLVFAKYLNIIIPDKEDRLHFEIDLSRKENEIAFSAIIKDEHVIFSKVKGTLSLNSGRRD